MCCARPSCFSLPIQVVRIALSFARDRAGNNMAARIAMMAMTTNSSIKVKANAFEGAFVCEFIQSGASARSGKRLTLAPGSLLVCGGRGVLVGRFMVDQLRSSIKLNLLKFTL